MSDVKCANCGAPVNGPPGAMACPYCGSRVDIPMAAPPPQQRLLVEEQPEERARARRHDSYEEDDDDERTALPSGNGNSALIGIVVAVIAVVTVIGIIAETAARKKKSSKDERKNTALAATTTKATKPSPPAYVESVAVPSCKCAFGDGQSTPLVTLTLKVPPLTDPTRALSLGIERQSGFVSESRSATLSISSPTVLSPTDGLVPQRLGVACEPGIYVLVGDKVATGWSSVNASWKWTTTLPAAMVDGADAGSPPLPRNTAFGSYCTPLATANGNATITLGSGRRATLSLKDGKLR